MRILFSFLILVFAQWAFADCQENAEARKRVSCQSDRSELVVDILYDETGACGTTSKDGRRPSISEKRIRMILIDIEIECDHESFSSLEVNLETGEGLLRSSGAAYDEYCEPESGGGSETLYQCTVSDL